MGGGINWLSLAMLALVAAAPTTTAPAPATRPTTRVFARKISDHDRAAIRSAVAALGAEYEQSRRSPSNAPLRTACDYFVEHPAGELPPEVIIAALFAPAGDVRQTAYVRWQLLSGLPETIDEATAKELIKAYRAAPGPIPRPGMSVEDQQKFDRMIQGARQADEPDFIAKAEEIVRTAQRDNAPILLYREELYRRLPKNLDTFAAALDDLFVRTAAGADGKNLLKSFCGDVKIWAGEADSPREAMAALGKGVRRLADTKSPPYYDTPYWREKAGVFAWRKTRSDVDSGHALKDLANLLEEQSRQPVIDLTIKENKQK
jgi:hypothetical protein